MALPVKSLRGQLRIFQFGVVSLGPAKCGGAGMLYQSNVTKYYAVKYFFFKQI